MNIISDSSWQRSPQPPIEGLTSNRPIAHQSKTEIHNEHYTCIASYIPAERESKMVVRHCARKWQEDDTASQRRGLGVGYVPRRVVSLYGQWVLIFSFQNIISTGVIYVLVL